MIWKAEVTNIRNT